MIAHLADSPRSSVRQPGAWAAAWLLCCAARVPRWCVMMCWSDATQPHARQPLSTGSPTRATPHRHVMTTVRCGSMTSQVTEVVCCVQMRLQVRMSHIRQPRMPRHSTPRPPRQPTTHSSSLPTSRQARHCHISSTCVTWTYAGYATESYYPPPSQASTATNSVYALYPSESRTPAARTYDGVRFDVT